MATQTYSTPGSYTFNLPVSTNITVKIAGAAGGSGGIDACSGGAPNVSGGTGGKGRYAEFTLPNYTYGSLTLVVGGPGGNGKNVGQTAFAGGSAGSNGGGLGGNDRPGGSSGGGGGGGGYSNISLSGTLLAVAGGGGGGGGASLCNYSGPNSSGYSYNGGNATTFTSTNSNFSASSGENGDGGASAGGDGGGVGGGGGGASGGNAGLSAGNDQSGGAAPANRADGGLGGGSKYRSDILTLSSQSVYTTSTNGFIEIEYTEVTFDQSAAGISTAGPYYATGEIKFSDIRRDFRAQQRKTSGSGSETFLTDNDSVSASGFKRIVSTSDTNPIVPNCQENNKISTGNDWKLSQFRNSIKFYYLTQDSSKTSLNYQIHGQPWNGNLTYNIVKTMFLEGTCGSVGVTTAAAVFDAQSYNLHVHVLGSLYGAGGSAGSASGGNGGNGGDALSINSNSAGTVTVKTVGGSSKVWGGGAGGGAGGNGGNGGNGSYSSSYSYEQSLGGSGQKNISGGQQYYDMCHNACRDAHGSSAYCKPNCYKLPWEGGCGCTCFSYQQGNQANCTCCYKVVSGTNTYSTSGGAGGDGGNGAAGRGYNNLTGQLTGIVADPPGIGNGPTSGGTNAGDGGQGGDGGDGGLWGENGGDGEDGDDGTDGNATNGADGDDGGNGGTAGRAVSGSGYLIDSNGVASAYKGLK